MSFCRFVRNRDGGVAPFLALSLLPMMAATGAAIDYSRANAARTSIQAALDSTGLMLSQQAATLQPAEIGARAAVHFRAVFHRTDVQNITLAHEFVSPQQGSFSLKLSATGNVPMIFAGVFGQSQVAVSAASEVVWGIKKLNLALALDNTGSMTSSKMSALKTAAHNLLDTLKAAEKVPGDIKVSIIPFATDVNVGTHNAGQSWIDWSDWEAKNGTCSKSGNNTQSACSSKGGTWTPKNRSAWNGCVYDRDQNNDVQAVATAGTAATKFRANQAANCPAAMMPLSEDWTALHAKIDTMTAAGNTNVTIGLAWAWQSLSPVAPLNAPEPQPDLDKVIILLTDGENTQNRWTSSTSSIDSRTQKACDNAKAGNIKLYTVRVINGNANLLRNCATKADMYYDVERADELNVVFKSIAQNLANLRIAR